MPTIGVLSLQGDVQEHVAALEFAGATVISVRRERELDEVDALVIPGGESTTIIKLAQHFDLVEPLRKRISGGMPTYGSCAGMILLADRILDGTADQTTFGGIDMTVRRNAFGRQVESFEEQVSVEGIDGGPFTAVFIRAPWVESVGPDATPLATVTTGPAAGKVVAIRQQHLLATSFHPELTGDARVHEYFVRMVRDGARSAGVLPEQRGGATS
ncbi:pyridoxal 5'-phosphate synthase glutaminase subunit PdxT [Jatrophihabitans telluris]|uniref:Pyridoxal 5'-phosphate synthase subunit PdxT n=1 Tax=Jatrophihabitans telluris TaxID=2038343 RepID=A0ABY4QSQ2_9ACTN|nr:pyridoxal 5'-phosphate synthase glutaminase subunit PdxT [Jatrophihabitans telluris]UQX86809.1 pyridoxal 5'-phosphate synthase glutaminase subunit PdxT [Jatrophihabitans telluris]